MDIFHNIALGSQVAFAPGNMLFCFVGVLVGTVIGLLPGIGALSTISLLLPLTFYMDPTTAIIMLAGIFYGAQYGGSTASILLNMPGTATNAITCLDGYPMAQQGRAGVALAMTTIASFVGGSLAIIVLMLLAPLIAAFAYEFGAAEYFAIMVFGLVVASSLSSGSRIKSLSMVVVGLLFGGVGMDIYSGTLRYQFGFNELAEGVSLVALVMGLFGVAEILNNLVLGSANHPRVTSVSLKALMPTREDVRKSIMPMLRGTGIGNFIGMLPGAGPTIASFLAYAVEKRVSRTPEVFGKGAVEGITAPESANNASVQAAFVPTLSLGIPGDPIMAVLLGALVIHGITPGPGLVLDQPQLFWGLIMSFWLGNLMLLLLNLPLIGVFVSILKIPYRALYVGMLFLICIGVYTVRASFFDVYLMIGFGALGFLMMLGGFPAAPLLLGFVLGPMIEENLRRALLIGRGDPLALVSSPISSTFLGLAVVMLVLPILRPLATRFRVAKPAA
ncbi:tripartite tricarboxylate transporter permease [Oricola thermophila]|uniref:Tripartite tricarboxylate transporter permease n=1 Tax=Oricola thermophila TaxID=2742145 RepID=A0A6N1VES2_9HYPH|nr:tripartite tricarboxylate transporter permease [Oricola thermophila]QKV19023.1 tripartite tricarboxylate transporter permease [Oricola thermophila]